MPNTTNFNWPTPADTDLVKDGAAAIRNLGNGVDTSLVDLKGGTTGQILSKASNADMDFTFITPNVGDITEVQAGTGISVASGTGPVPVVTNTVATTFDAKGDLVVGTGADTFAKLTVGTNGYTLVADSSTATGLAYAAPAGGGAIKQYVYARSTSTTTSSTSTYIDATGLTATITPASNSNQVLVFVSFDYQKGSGNAGSGLDIKLQRGGTDINASLVIGYNGTSSDVRGTYTMIYLDSPATTSATTYKIVFANDSNAASVTINPYATSSGVPLANATITLMEV